MFFRGDFTDPVVVAGPASENDAEPGAVVIRNVDAQSFEIRFAEWDYLDGIHGSEEVTYVIAERGVTNLPSGARVETGTVLADDTGWTEIDFSNNFGGSPSFAATISSVERDSTASVRARSLNSGAVDLRLYPEEANSTLGIAEMVSWIAWSTGSGSLAVDGFDWETGSLATDEQVRTADFSRSFSNPCAVGTAATNFPNPATTRMASLDSDSLSIRHSEEQSRDNETGLGNETVRFLVAECGAGPAVDEEVPSWSAGASISVAALSARSIDISWDATLATDDLLLEEFIVYVNGVEVTRTPASSISGVTVSPDSSVTITVQAVDSVGNVSVDGPSTTVQTPAVPQGRISGFTAIDGDEDGIADADLGVVVGAPIALYRDDGQTAGALDEGDSFVAAVATAANGSWTFEELDTGTYVVASGTATGFLAPVVDTQVVELQADASVNVASFLYRVDPNPIEGVPFGVFSHPERFGETFPEYSALRFTVADTDDALEYLELARATNTRVIISMTGNASRNEDKTLNEAVWRAEVDQFAEFDFQPYVTDGTLIGHYILDEPKCRNCWGGRVLTHDQIEELAQHSKELFPYLPVIVRQEPSLLERHADGFNQELPGYEWQYVDIAWAQYVDRKGPIGNYVAEEVAGAIEQDLGLIWGLNILAGGDGSSGTQPGPEFNPNLFTMTENEIVRYGTEMLESEYGCALISFRYERFDEDFFDPSGPLYKGVDRLAATAAESEPGSCGVRHNG